MGGLAGGVPRGLEAVSEQLAGMIAVLRAEQGRRQVGTAVTRSAWKNLVFTGGPRRILGLALQGPLHVHSPSQQPGRSWSRSSTTTATK
jgi:hypothetical protein